MRQAVQTHIHSGVTEHRQTPVHSIQCFNEKYNASPSTQSLETETELWFYVPLDTVISETYATSKITI